MYTNLADFYLWPIEALKKEQDTSQWAGIPPEKLLQDSFFKQLNSIQILEQLAPLHTAREHLPKDIVEILELLGKSDNIPFNQLYNLEQDCANHDNTKVIKTLTHLLKCNFTDRQTDSLSEYSKSIEIFEVTWG